MKNGIEQLVIAFLVLRCAGSAAQRPQPDAVTSLPFAQVSKAIVSPTELKSGKSGAVALVTVSVFHSSIPKGKTESVTLEVGTGSTFPPNVVSPAIYKPANQTIKLSGDAGRETADVKVSVPPCPSDHPSCTITIQPSLSRPSAGITIREPDPPDYGRAALTVTNK